MFDWNDLRYLLAVAEAGTTAGAARSLKTSQPTVVRRIAALEECVGLPLFDRHSLGYRLTPHGADLLPLAQKVADAVDEFEMRVRTRNRSGSATIRLTLPEASVTTITPLLVPFRQRFPDTRVEMQSDDAWRDLAKGEADVAIRAGYNISTDGLAGMCVSDNVAWALYASHSYVDSRGVPADTADLPNHAIIGADGPIGQSPPFEWLDRHAGAAAVVWRSNLLSGLLSAAKAGMGIAPLPCSIGGSEAGLEPVSRPIPGIASTMWILTRPELRLDPAVKYLMEMIKTHVGERLGIYSGADIKLRGE